MKLRRIITAFCLQLAGFALVAHSVIPHDHHLFSTVNDTDQCPVSHEHPSQHPVFPAHCHAFNDMAAEKAVKLVIKKDSGAAPAEIILIPLTHSVGLPFSGRIKGWAVSLASGRFAEGLAPLRAPPASC